MFKISHILQGTIRHYFAASELSGILRVTYIYIIYWCSLTVSSLTNDKKWNRCCQNQILFLIVVLQIPPVAFYMYSIETKYYIVAFSGFQYSPFSGILLHFRRYRKKRNNQSFSWDSFKSDTGNAWHKSRENVCHNDIQKITSSIALQIDVPWTDICHICHRSPRQEGGIGTFHRTRDWGSSFWEMGAFYTIVLMRSGSAGSSCRYLIVGTPHGTTAVGLSSSLGVLHVYFDRCI